MALAWRFLCGEEVTCLGWRGSGFSDGAVRERFAAAACSRNMLLYVSLAFCLRAS